ncbi:MAG: NAD(P)H-hydrate dehydratase, partial [Planctomycetaceae bacterium]
MTVERISQLPGLPARPADAHKGTFGKVLIIGGSSGMSGAAALAGQGALRGGAGLVFVAVPITVQPIVASLEASYLTVGLPESAEGQIAGTAQAVLEQMLPRYDAVAIGPGIGRSAELTELVRAVFAAADLPLVVDADALNALADGGPGATCPGFTAARVLTPHPGEFARLIGGDVATVQSRREETAVAYAAQNDVVLVLKGHGTLVTDGQRLAENTTGNSGMATGGSGDVLTGLLAALLAQGMPAFEAAQLAVHLHGLAGDLVAEELTQPGLIASDLPRFLPAA